MTNKVELNTLTQVVHKEQAFLNALNENFLRLQQAINDTLSRTGVVPNQMEEVLDMNGKRIVNVGAAEEDTDALTREFIQGLIADVEAAVARLTTLVEEAKQALEIYAAEYILPPAIAARDAAIAAKDAAKGYYDDTKDLYDALKVLVDNVDILLQAPEYATKARVWAEGSDAEVQQIGGTHSAKKWAELSQADVTAEATARQNADIGLQNQIDAIVAGADVRDIVGTYTDLQNYDTSGLNNNDVVKVITDSTHNNASSYYKWIIVGGVGSWNYIGSEGPYLTPAAAAATYVPKTTTINGKALSSDIVLAPSDVGAATAAQGTKADTAVQPAAIANMQVTTNLVTSMSSASTDAQYPSAKLFFDTCGDIETLINAL